MAVKRLGKSGRTRFYVDNVDVPFLQMALAEFRKSSNHVSNKTQETSESKLTQFSPLGDRRQWDEFCWARIDSLIEAFRVEDKSYNREKIVQFRRK